MTGITHAILLMIADGLGVLAGMQIERRLRENRRR